MNKMEKIALFALSTLLLTSCAQRQYQPTAGEIQRGNSVQTENLAIKTYNSCFESAMTRPDIAPSYKIVDEQVAFQVFNSPNKLALMSSAAKITEPQKKALLTFLGAIQSCRTGVVSDLRSLPTLAVIYENYQGDLDILYSKLISKKITIGEANQQKSQLFSKLKADYTTATQNLNNQYNSQINQEMQARQQEDAQRRAIAAQYMMNQQAIQAQQNIANQQRLQNQINQNKSITTNCNRFGNQVNCTSY